MTNSIFQVLVVSAALAALPSAEAGGGTASLRICKVSERGRPARCLEAPASCSEGVFRTVGGARIRGPSCLPPNHDRCPAAIDVIRALFDRVKRQAQGSRHLATASTRGSVTCDAYLVSVGPESVWACIGNQPDTAELIYWGFRGVEQLCGK